MERLKILRAAAALETFTLDALATYAGVSRGTAQTVLTREAALFPHRRTAPTGRAGGQPIVYGIAADELRRRIDEEAAAHPTGRIPLALAAGYDTLLRRVPETGDPGDREDLLSDAILALRLAQDEWPRHTELLRLDLHQRTFAALVRLARVEQLSLLDARAWRDLSTTLGALAIELLGQDEAVLAAELGVRLAHSPMQRRVCEQARRQPARDAKIPVVDRIFQSMRSELELAGREG